MWTVIVIVLVLWFLGLLGNVAGSFIHLLLAVALILFIVDLIDKRRTR